jgi:hypothetical protein
MYKTVTSALVLAFSLTLLNAGTDTNKKQASSTKTPQKEKLSKEELEKQIQAQIEREKKYAKEQTFYKGKDYNLSEKQVDPKTLKNVPKIEPDYDFDITDVYRDDI